MRAMGRWRESLIARKRAPTWRCANRRSRCARSSSLRLLAARRETPSHPHCSHLHGARPNLCG
ncbi:hypothetical protein C7T87_06325 [Xanthomonas hortorum pv. hederae]|nr:hypothetical protein C7T87_06325 [Xanthomonas hortorum pv. hederae]